MVGDQVRIPVLASQGKEISSFNLKRLIISAKFDIFLLNL